MGHPSPELAERYEHWQTELAYAVDALPDNPGDAARWVRRVVDEMRAASVTSESQEVADLRRGAEQLLERAEREGAEWQQQSRARGDRFHSRELHECELSIARIRRPWPPDAGMRVRS